MAKNTVFILLGLGLLLSSCKKNTEEIKPAVYDFEVVKTFEVLLDKQDRNLWRENIMYPYHITEMDKVPILILNSKQKKITFYDIENGKKFHEIFTDQTRLLDSFKYINKDSIFCYYYGDYHAADLVNTNYGQLQLVDYNGNVKQLYKYNVDSVELQKRNLDIDKILPPSNTESDIPISERNLFFSSPDDYVNILGTKKFIENPLPILTRYNTSEQKFYISKHKNFPYIKEGIHYPTSFDYKSVCISGNSFPLIRFVYSSDVFEWDYKNDKIITHSLKSRLLDTIKPLTKPARESNNLEEAYYDISYDKYSGLYYSYLDFRENFYGNLSDGRGISTIIIANKDFEYLGEVYSNNYYPGKAFTKDYIVDYSFKNDSIIEIYYIKLVKTDRNYDKYIDSCKKDLEIRKQKKQTIGKDYNSIKDYIIKFLKSKKEVNIPDYTVVTVYAQGGCLGCTESVLGLISRNRDIYENAPFYLIITANDAQSAYRELKGYGLDDFKNLVIDSTGIIRNLTDHDGIWNPRLIFVEDNKIILDTIYNSYDIHKELIPKIIEKIEEKKVVIIETPLEE